MTFKSVNRKISRASIALLSVLSLSSIASFPANAQSAAAKTSKGKVTIHAQQASPHMTDTGEVDNFPGTTNDGSVQTGLGGTMANVTFSATPIILAGTSSGTNNSIPDYSKDNNRKEQSQTTDKDGVAEFSGLTDGYYLFHQVTTIGGILTIQDFVVNVNTSTNDVNAIDDVNVYPKLDLTPVNDLQKIALTNAGKNFNDKTPDEIVGTNKIKDTSQEINAIKAGKLVVGDAGNETTAGAGDTVTWNLNSIFDASQVTYTRKDTDTTDTTDIANTAGIYTITDILPVGVTYSTATPLIVSVANDKGEVTSSLNSATDYTVSVSNKEIKIDLTTDGQLNAAKSLGNKTGQINVQLPTTVDANFVGRAENSVTTTTTNAFGVTIGNSEVKKAAVNVGGVEIEKVNGANETLKGATFVLVRAKDEAAAKALVTANAAEIKNDGSITGLTDKGTTAEFVKDTTGKIIARTTGDDGLAAWTGLNLVDSDTNTTNSTNYFAVEIQAPTGYELPSPTTAANVFAVTADTDNKSGATNITNNRPFDLPFTGGTGIAAILLLATVAGIGAIVIRRKKNEENEEVSK